MPGPNKYQYVSRKKFDYSHDRLVEKYVRLKREVDDLRRMVKQILAWKGEVLAVSGKSLPPPPPK